DPSSMNAVRLPRWADEARFRCQNIYVRLFLLPEPLLFHEVHGTGTLLGLGLPFPVLDFDDVAVEKAALGDHEGIRLDVAADPPRRGDLHVARGHHVALVLAHDDGVHGPDVGGHHALLADHELAPHVQLAPDLTLDLDRVGDFELALHPGVVADDGEEGGGDAGLAVVGSLLAAGSLRATPSEHRDLLLLYWEQMGRKVTFF